MFFTRDFVWVPQLALYKSYKRLPLSADEQCFLREGFTRFQQQIKTVYSSVGYGG
jgi:hypothetical protein